MSRTHPNYTHEAPSQDRVQTQPLCWGEPTKSWISPNENKNKNKNNPPPNKQTSIIAVICPVYSSSPSHIHLCFPSLPSVKPVWHLPAASSALRLIRSYLAHKRRASSRKRSYCKYDNSIRCSNQLCQWVTRARAHPHRNIWDRKQFTVSEFVLLHICPALMLISEEIKCHFYLISSQTTTPRNVMNNRTGFDYLF